MAKNDTKIILALRKKFPGRISVLVRKTQNGYMAEIIGPEICRGGFTQASSFSELIAQVNDCVQTILEIPEQYSSSMPQYMPPLSLAQELNEFPRLEFKGSVQFSINKEYACV